VSLRRLASVVYAMLLANLSAYAAYVADTHRSRTLVLVVR
jgi:hypothetical protein